MTAVLAGNAFTVSSLATSPSRVGDHVLAVTGSAFGYCAKILQHIDFFGSSLLVLDQLLPGVGVGDYVRLHVLNNLFDQISASESLSGDVEYRGIFVRNETDVVLDAVKLYLAEPGGGAPVPALASKRGALSQIGTISSEDEAPDVSSTLSDANARFEHMLTYALSYPGNPTTLSNLNQQPAWIRRTVPALSGPQDDIAWLVVLEGTNTGGDPNPIRSAALVTFGGDGYDPQLSVQEDRYVRVGGGARISALVEDEAGTPLEEYDVEWSLDGDGSLDASIGQTDEDGETAVAYTAPTGQEKAGQSAVVTARII